MELEEEAISEIPVADTTRNQELRLAMLKTNLRRRRGRRRSRRGKKNSSSKPQAATRGGGLPIWGLLPGRNTNIHPVIGPAKGMKKIEVPHINKDSSPLSVLVFFFSQKFFICWWDRPIYTTSNT
jgi:hypothetical protein